MNDKQSASFWSTRSMEMIRSSCWMGFLGQCDTEGRLIGEGGDLGEDPGIESIEAGVDVTGAGLSCTGGTISPSPLALTT